MTFENTVFSDCDATLIQNNVERVLFNFSDNSLFLNIQKCHYNCFTRNRILLKTQYSISISDSMVDRAQMWFVSNKLMLNRQILRYCWSLRINHWPGKNCWKLLLMILVLWHQHYCGKTLRNSIILRLCVCYRENCRPSVNEMKIMCLPFAFIYFILIEIQKKKVSMISSSKLHTCNVKK